MPGPDALWLIGGAWVLGCFLLTGFWLAMTVLWDRHLARKRERRAARRREWEAYWHGRLRL